MKQKVEMQAETAEEARRERNSTYNSGNLRVKVRHSETLEPLENAEVTLRYPGSDGGKVASEMTQDDGVALIRGIAPNEEMEPPGLDYRMQVAKEGFEKEDVKDIKIVPEETTEKLVQLTKKEDRGMGKLRVRVREAGTNEPVEGAVVKVLEEKSIEKSVVEEKTNQNGTTKVMELPVLGNKRYYRIEVEKEGYKDASINRVDIEKDENIIENIYLVPDSNSMQTMETPIDDVMDSNERGESNRVDVQPTPIPNPGLESGVGSLRVDVVSILRSQPIVSATVKVYQNGDTGEPLHVLTTDMLGRTEVLELETPNIAYSLTPSVEQPYATYDLLIEVPGFESIATNNVEILPDVLAIHNISMIPLDDAQGESAELYVIPPHTLYGEYPPKIAESEVKPVDETGEIVLSKVVIPEYVVVHDGPPSDSSAPNYYVKYRDYVKNVASSEIYATWPQATIIANVLCIQSFLLNRVYTEWYRNKGYTFTITNSTAFDQKYIAGRNVFDTISEAVDQVFANYVSRPGLEQPLFTQFCDGKRVYCPNWLSQWGSKDLGEQGYTAVDILRFYYGDDVFIATAEAVSGVPSSWPGADLEVGTRSDAVRQIQRELNVISNGYPLIPKISQDGVYGEKTKEAVQVFQGIFGLPETGVIDFPTWYKISEIYVGVSRIAELN